MSSSYDSFFYSIVYIKKRVALKIKLQIKKRFFLLHRIFFALQKKCAVLKLDELIKKCISFCGSKNQRNQKIFF
ncbi:hypothetical protein EGI32_08405 [Ferruginibacter sp. HRS2-29]|nr:hypothetical protein [Ferruginibacter sp. HRS2-29]